MNKLHEPFTASYTKCIKETSCQKVCVSHRPGFWNKHRLKIKYKKSEKNMKKFSLYDCPIMRITSNFHQLSEQMNELTYLQNYK